MRVRPRPLTGELFAPYGEVIGAAGDGLEVNAATARRYPDLAEVDVSAKGGRVRLSVFRVEAPHVVTSVGTLERHPLGSQTFVPMAGQRFLVVVAPGGSEPRPEGIGVFVTDGRQGVHYRRGTWHQPLVSLDPGDFLVIDRGGEGENCDIVALDPPIGIDW